MTTTLRLTVSIWEETNDTYRRCDSILSPAAGVVEKPTTLSMHLHLKWKISFIDERSRRQYVPEVHIPTGMGRPICVDFYTHGTLEDGDEDRSQVISIFSSQFSQFSKSQVFRTWDSGEESCSCVCHFGFALLLLFTCCSARLFPICPLFC